MADEFRIEGCHGTIAEQKDEAFYDDRSDASDDEEKGKIKFPTRLYGREKELGNLKRLYAGLLAGEENEISNSQVVFLSGYRYDYDDFIVIEMHIYILLSSYRTCN